MAKKYRQRLRDISSVAVSSTVVINLPVGPRYHQVNLQYGYTAGTAANTIAAALGVTVAAAGIQTIRVKRNGRTQRTIKGFELRDANLLFGTGYDVTGLPNPVVSAAGTKAVDGINIPIFFAEPWRQEPDAQDALAWSTDGWESFTIEVDLGLAPGSTADSTAPFLRANAVFDNVINRNAIVKWIRTQVGASGTAFDYTQFDKRDLYQQITIYPCSGAPTLETSRATFRVDGEVLHEFTQTEVNAILNQNGMVPRASGRTDYLYDLVFDHDGFLGSAVPLFGARDVNLTIEAISAMSGTTLLLIQRLGAPE